MGGLDKGLQAHDGVPLALHVVRRLGPQVATVLVNANRNLDAYAALGAPVVADTLPDRPGPLAGFLAGLERCATPLLVAVPCDVPGLPLDLVARLREGLDGTDAELAIAATRAVDDGARGDAEGERLQPTFCLMRTTVAPALRAYLAGGGRKIATWTAMHRRAVVRFDDADAFANVNSLADLAALARRRHG